MDGRWQLSPGLFLRCHGWDDEFALYNNLSGDTHLLGFFAIHVLQLLEQGPGTESELLARLGAEFDTDDQPAALASLQQVLAQMKSLALVQAA